MKKRGITESGILLAAVIGVLLGCEGEQPTQKPDWSNAHPALRVDCGGGNEYVCRPSWWDDCTCYSNTQLHLLPNGDVLCYCPGGPLDPTTAKSTRLDGGR